MKLSAVFLFMLLNMCKLAAQAAAATSAPAPQSLLSMTSDLARIELGSKGDIKVMRTGNNELTIAADLNLVGSFKVKGVLLSKLISNAIIAATTTPTTTTTTTTTTTGTFSVAEIADSMTYLRGLTGETDDQLKALTTLNLQEKQIDAAGAKLLAPALAQLTGLAKLMCYNNQIGDEGAKAWASALEKLTGLTYLDLGKNKIGDEGAKALASALEKLTGLTYLDLGMNTIGDEGVKALAPVLEKLTGLKRLIIPAKIISDVVKNQLKSKLSFVTELLFW